MRHGSVPTGVFDVHRSKNSNETINELCKWFPWSHCLLFLCHVHMLGNLNVSLFFLPKGLKALHQRE